MGPRYAVLVNRLLHTNLSIFYHSVFFSMCKAHGIGYDTKVNTMLTLPQNKSENNS